MEVSVSPSVSDQPALHLVRSTVQPSGPVSVLPSADLPHLPSLMRFTMASRWVAQRASHSWIDLGCAAGAAAADVVVAPPDAAVVELDAAAAVVVVASPALSPLSSPPHAAA